MHETKASLLIVDDEPSIRTSLSLILAEIGYRVRTAEDGVSALVAIQEEVPEILLSDLNMPGMSGFDLLSAVRRSFPLIRTIAMSGAFSGDEVPSGVAADAFYQKGSSVCSLLKIVENLPAYQKMPARSATEPAPLWDGRDGPGYTGEAYAMASRPVSPRTSSQTLS